MKDVVENKLNIPPDYQYNALTKGSFLQKQWHANRLTLISHTKFLSPHDSVADVGCGSGNTIFTFHNKVLSLWGFDYNSECIEYVNNTINKLSISNAHAVRMDLSDPVPEQFVTKFDKIIMAEVIEHFTESEVAVVLNNVKHMLVNGGSVLITTPNYGLSLWPVMEKTLDLLKITPTLWGEQHHMKFTPRMLIKTCQEAGLKVEKSGTFSFISLFTSFLGTGISGKFARWEIDHLKVLGPQIYIIAKK